MLETVFKLSKQAYESFIIINQFALIMLVIVESRSFLVVISASNYWLLNLLKGIISALNYWLLNLFNLKPDWKE